MEPRSKAPLLLAALAALIVLAALGMYWFGLTPLTSPVEKPAVNPATALSDDQKANVLASLTATSSATTTAAASSTGAVPRPAPSSQSTQQKLQVLKALQGSR
jgi:hypothetical protein